MHYRYWGAVLGLVFKGELEMSYKTWIRPHGMAASCSGCSG